MGVFDDDRLSQMMDLKPFSDWLNPTRYGETSVVTPEGGVWREVEEVQGGIVVRDKQAQSRVTLEKGLHIDQVEGSELRISGLIPGGRGTSPVWEMSAETKEVRDANSRRYKELHKGELRPESGERAVWELSGAWSQEELVRLGLAEKTQEVVTLGEEFIPDPTKPPKGYDHLKAVQEVADKLKHEALNVYGEQGVFGPYLSPTWWMFLEELQSQLSEFDDIREAEESLRKTLYERLSLEPGAGLDGGEQYLMGARYELPVFGQDMVHTDAMLPQVEDPLAWVDFLAGFAYGDCEMLTMVGEVTTEKDQWPTSPDEGDMPVPPVPEEMFDEETYGEKKTAHNLMWLESDRVDVFSDGVSGEPTPDAPNWWLRVNFVGDEKYPYPGEFLGLGVRIFPNLTWGSQKNSPFLYGGHWIDTAFITSGTATVTEKHQDGYYLCTMDWRKDKNLKVYPSDFAQYEVGDRLTVLKTITTTKKSQLWKDEDCFKFDKEIWRVVPLTYYGKGIEV